MRAILTQPFRYLEIAAIARRLHYLQQGYLDDAPTNDDAQRETSVDGSKYSFNPRSVSDLKTFSILSCFIFSVVWLASAACQFYPELHYFTEAELQSGKYKVSMCGRVLLFCARLVHVSIRLITFVFFISLFKWIIFVVLGLHCTIYYISLLIYRCTGSVLKSGYRPDPKLPTVLDERLKVSNQ
ncbi:unnamed protein product [Dibothriocephalus latus]|uniref:XK-related protein n=1 Tax=Dibothriocephalus latus TaxID=60516 RepID=A0A3P6V5V6_DIBLA|nr:unnamed protein product [Dibothriocephalus latus]